MGGSSDPQPSPGALLPPGVHGAAGLASFLSGREAWQLAFLFEAALQTLHAVCQRRLGATPGTIAVLHTWSQTLAFHPHVHCIVTGGGLNAARDHWIAARPAFLVPVRVLSRVFRGKLLEAFEHALAARTAGIGSSFGRRLLQQASAKDWVVYSKAPMAGPAQVLRYLGRYTHRIAIGNERLVALQDGRVTFRYRDRRHGNQQKLLTLDASVFVHVSFCTCCHTVSFASDISAFRPMAVVHAFSPRLGASWAHQLPPHPTPPFGSPGKTSSVASPAATPASAPTANAELFAWSPPNPTPAHERPMRRRSSCQTISAGPLHRYSSARSRSLTASTFQVSSGTTRVPPAFALRFFIYAATAPLRDPHPYSPQRAASVQSPYAAKTAV